MDDQATDFSEEAQSFTQELVDAGEYPTVSAMASAALLRLKEQRTANTHAVEQEILRRNAAPREEWIVWTPGDIVREYKADRSL